MNHEDREGWIAQQMSDVLNEAHNLDMDPVEYVLARISADLTAIRQMVEDIVDDRRRPKEGDEWKRS